MTSPRGPFNFDSYAKAGTGAFYKFFSRLRREVSSLERSLCVANANAPRQTKRSRFHKGKEGGREKAILELTPNLPTGSSFNNVWSVLSPAHRYEVIQPVGMTTG